MGVLDKKEERKFLEAEFHDKVRDRELEKNKEEFDCLTSNRKYYTAARRSQECIVNLVKTGGVGKTVLDFCCGEGDSAFQMLEGGAVMAYGIDISPYSIEICRKTAEEKGLSGKTDFRVMDGENMTFEENKFDFIVCAGVLHHLDVKKVYPGLLKVIKKDGVVVCSEPLIYNPIFQLYRRLTPQLRTAWETEHILKKEDIFLSKEYFGEIEMSFFNLFTLIAVPFRNTFIFNPLLRVLEAIDSVVLKIPGIRWLAWQCIYTLRNPKK